MQVVLKLRPEEGGVLLMFAPAGVIGYIGLNSMGLGLVTNQLYAPPQLGLSGYFIMRRHLSCHTVQEVLTWLDNNEIGSASNYLFGRCDGPHRRCRVRERKDWYDRRSLSVPHETLSVRGNGDLDNGARNLANSHYRLERASSLFGDGAGYDNALAASQDHEGLPTSVCRHDTEMVTGASILIELDSSRMLVGKGNPCVGKYETYKVA